MHVGSRKIHRRVGGGRKKTRDNGTNCRSGNNETGLLQCPISALYRLYIGPMSALYRLYIDPTSALYRPYIGPILALYRPYIGPISALYWLYIGPISAVAQSGHRRAGTQNDRLGERLPDGAWINDAGHRSDYCGLTMLVTVQIIAD